MVPLRHVKQRKECVAPEDTSESRVVPEDFDMCLVRLRDWETVYECTSVRDAREHYVLTLCSKKVIQLKEHDLYDRVFLLHNNESTRITIHDFGTGSSTSTVLSRLSTKQFSSFSLDFRPRARRKFRLRWGPRKLTQQLLRTQTRRFLAKWHGQLGREVGVGVNNEIIA